MKGSTLEETGTGTVTRTKPDRAANWSTRTDPARLDKAFLHFRRFQESLGIELTMRCPLKCGHCSYDSGPERTEVVDAGTIVPFVADACVAGNTKLVIISGGEPFLEPDLVTDIASTATNAGSAVAVNTSAYWAKNIRKGTQFLSGFPDVTHLNISVDKYHDEFVPLTHARNAVEVGLALGKIVTLMVRVWDTRNDPYLDVVEDVFGAELLDRIAVDLQQIVADGRGRKLPEAQLEIALFDSKLPEGNCDLAHQPTVNTCGTVVACCNHNVAIKHPALQLGNINTESFSSIAARARDNRFLHAIRVWGPAEIARRLRLAGMGDQLKGVYKKNDICSLCEDIVSQPELVENATKLLDSEEAYSELYLSRLLKFGEFFPASSTHTQEPT